MPTLRPYTSMSRTRLAQLYCPDVTPRHAWRTLKAWMDRCRPLLARLRRPSAHPFACHGSRHCGVSRRALNRRTSIDEGDWQYPLRRLALSPPPNGIPRARPCLLPIRAVARKRLRFETLVAVNRNFNRSVNAI